MDADEERFHWYKTDKSFINGGIGDGINKFDIPGMYKDYIKKELDEYGEFIRYGEGYGSPFLSDVFSLFERYIATNGDLQCDSFCKYLTVTSGASTALFLLFSYISEKYHDHKIKMLGWQYYLFEHHCKNFGLDSQYLISKSENRIMPTIDEIHEYMDKSNNDIVILTVPGNPSGEVYTYRELVDICKLCVQNNDILVIDKCQMEVLSESFDYLNIGAAIIEAKAEDHVICIDSISKTRSLPGVRIGYIYSNCKELHDYMNYYASVIYSCPTRGLESAIGMDILARCLYYAGENRKIISKYRSLVLLDCGYDVYNKVYGTILSDKDRLKEVLDSFTAEICKNYDQIKRNYQKARSVFRQIPGCRVTELQGGFNFCVYLKDDNKMGEVAFISRISELTNAKMIPQCCWGAKTGEKGENGYWCRISIAVDEEVMDNYLGRIVGAIKAVNK